MQPHGMYYKSWVHFIVDQLLESFDMEQSWIHSCDHFLAVKKRERVSAREIGFQGRDKSAAIFLDKGPPYMMSNQKMSH